MPFRVFFKFQFQTGSIKSVLEFFEVDSLEKVSIPNWFD